MASGRQQRRASHRVDSPLGTAHRCPRFGQRWARSSSPARNALAVKAARPTRRCTIRLAAQSTSVLGFRCHRVHIGRTPGGALLRRERAHHGRRSTEALEQVHRSARELERRRSYQAPRRRPAAWPAWRGREGLHIQILCCCCCCCCCCCWTSCSCWCRHQDIDGTRQTLLCRVKEITKGIALHQLWPLLLELRETANTHLHAPEG
jgi:hypothetical protein